MRPARKRMARTCALLMAVPVPAGLVAQTDAYRESVNRDSVDEDGDGSLHLALRNPEVTAPGGRGAPPSASRPEGAQPVGQHPAPHRRALGQRHRHHRSASARRRRLVGRKTKTAAVPRTSQGTSAATRLGWHTVVPKGTLAPRRTFNGRLTSSDAVWDDGSHYDVWTVTAGTVRQHVAIDMASDDVDAYLTVHRKDGAPLGTDDHERSGSNTRGLAKVRLR